MKRISRIFVVLIALILVATMVPAAYAADATPGKQASVSFTIKDVYGINGEFSFSNADMISGDVSYKITGIDNGSVTNNTAYAYSSKLSDVKITVTFTVNKSAKNGDKCDIKFRYETSDIDGNMSGDKPNGWYTLTETVVVKVAGQTEPKPEKPGTSVDYTELKNQINAAKALKEEEYTADSWAALQDALKKAEEALKSKDQSVVDAAAAALADAIKNLKKLDYTALIEAIEKTEEFLAGDLLGGKGTALVEALQNAKALLNNAKDQESIDKAAQALMTALTELMEVLEQLANKPADKEPTGEFCNISIHYVWPILFFISLAVNAVLVILYFVRRKKNEAAAE